MWFSTAMLVYQFTRGYILHDRRVTIAAWLIHGYSWVIPLIRHAKIFGLSFPTELCKLCPFLQDISFSRRMVTHTTVLEVGTPWQTIAEVRLHEFDVATFRMLIIAMVRYHVGCPCWIIYPQQEILLLSRLWSRRTSEVRAHPSWCVMAGRSAFNRIPCKPCEFNLVSCLAGFASVSPSKAMLKGGIEQSWLGLTKAVI